MPGCGLARTFLQQNRSKITQNALLCTAGGRGSRWLDSRGVGFVTFESGGQRVGLRRGGPEKGWDTASTGPSLEGTFRRCTVVLIYNRSDASSLDHWFLVSNPEPP